MESSVSPDRVGSYSTSGYGALQGPIFDLLGSISTLREIATLELRNFRQTNQIERAISILGPDRESEVEEFIENFRKLLDDAIEGRFPEDGRGLNTPIPNHDLVALTLDIIRDGQLRAAKTDARATVHRSLLITAVSDFEVYLGKVAGHVMRKSPGILNSEESSITLLELEQLENVEEARDVIIERRVDALLQGSLDAWVEWFAKRKGNLLEQSLDWNELREIFARRHLMVHTGGRVNPNYKKRCPQEAVALGDLLSVDFEYLERALNLLLAVALQVHFSCALKFSNNPDAVHPDVGVFNNSLSKSDLHLAAKNFTARCLVNIGHDLERKLVLEARIANWVARRELGEVVAVKHEAEEFDISGLDVRFGYTKKILCGLTEEAARLTVFALQENELSVIELETNPLFDDETKRAVRTILSTQRASAEAAEDGGSSA